MSNLSLLSKFTTRPASVPSTGPEEALYRISNLAFGWRVALWAAMLVTGVFLEFATNPILVVFGVVLAGVAMAHGVELTHQALHHTGFRSRRLNEIVGFMTGFPMLVSFHAYRIDHLRHHAFLGTPQDREFFDYGGSSGGWRTLADRYLMRKHFIAFGVQFFNVMRGRPVEGYADRQQARVRPFYFVASGVFALLLGACAFMLSPSPLLAWLVPLLTVAAPLHALIETPEHYECDRTTPDILLNTRSIATNRFLTWLTNSNNFHVEHHLHPAIPMQNLLYVHQGLRSRISNLSMGYFDFYRRHRSSGRTA